MPWLQRLEPSLTMRRQKLELSLTMRKSRNQPFGPLGVSPGTSPRLRNSTFSSTEIRRAQATRADENPDKSKGPTITRLLRVSAPPDSQQIDLKQKKTKRKDMSDPEYHVVASRLGCNEEFIRKETLWNTYPLEILD